MGGRGSRYCLYSHTHRFIGENMKKCEFSKIIMTAFGVVALIVVVFTLMVVWKTDDVSPLDILIPAVFAGLTTATGFYYSKAKTENKIKLRTKYGAEIYDDVINKEDFENEN